MAAKLHSERVPSLPKYRESLALEERKSYDEKLKLIDNIDPYNLSNFLYSESMELWPEIEFPASQTICSSPRVATPKSNSRLIKA